MTDYDDMIPKNFIYVFPAVIDSWHDGDTCTVHRGSKPGEIIHGEKVRVQGINAAELSKAGGGAARDHANGLAPAGTLVTLTASKEEKYNRFLARITLPDGQDFGDLMIRDGFAVPFLV